MSQPSYTQYELDELAREMRYGLAQAGWIAPHRFVLQNEDKAGSKLQHLKIDCNHMVYPHISQQTLQQTGLSRRQLVRTRYYRGTATDGEMWLFQQAPLHQALRFAASRQYLSIVEVRTDFADIWGQYGVRREEWDSQVFDYTLTPESEWMLLCQGKGYHGVLLHRATQHSIQFEDDQELVHVAEAFVLFHLYRERLPANLRNAFTDDTRCPLTVEDLPEQGRYSLPDWFARFANAVLAGKEWWQ